MLYDGKQVCADFIVDSVTASYLIRYESLLQNAPDIITKRDSYFIIKCDISLLQNASGFLLQNATVLLQNATILLQNATVNYKMRRLLQIATTHSTINDEKMKTFIKANR